MNAFKLLLIPLIEPLIDFTPAQVHDLAESARECGAEVVGEVLHRIGNLLEMDELMGSPLHNLAQRAREFSLIADNESKDITIY